MLPPLGWLNFNVRDSSKEGVGGIVGILHDEKGSALVIFSCTTGPSTFSLCKVLAIRKASHSNHQAGPGNSAQHFPPPPLLPPHGGGEGAGSIRPGSMADRARLVNILVPEVALKCPRCESTNTKFCYFNNYSLTQPRHLCKTCKRYWTRGGALRNVPVGGGCRRNKRSKGSVPKSPVRGDRQTAS
ncbi:hypothetical protein Golax_017179, partial [Gossypium laxum]|nr:hypothetical protein [Gossypium laxum]